MRAARFSRALVAVALLCAASPVLAQTTYPTQYGGRVSGVVPLVCDTNGANCQPNGSTGAVAPQVQGNVASGIADTGNPVKIGGVYSSSLPTLTSGQRGDVQLSVAGTVLATLTDSSNSTVMSIFSSGADGLSNFNRQVVTAGFLYGYNGSSFDRMRGDVNGLAVQPALSTAFWSFAPASGGILNTTTAVTVKAAAGAGVRNYIAAMQCNSEALTTATELAIRDGAGGTVLWRGKIPTTGWTQGREMVFNAPLRGTANTLTEIVTLTASGAGAVYCNLQGYTGS